MALAYRYVGTAGAFLTGVPTRNIEADELQGLAANLNCTEKELRALLDASADYRGGSEPKPAPKAPKPKAARKKAVKPDVPAQAVTTAGPSLQDVLTPTGPHTVVQEPKRP